METTELFTARNDLNQTIRALALEAQAAIAAAISDGLYPDGLTVPLDAVNKIVGYYISVTPDTAPIEDETE